MTENILYKPTDIDPRLSSRVSPLTLVLSRGDHLQRSITQFVSNNHMQSATLSGLGALENATISYYDRDNKKRYLDKTFTGPYELISLNGNIAWKENSDEPLLHIHVALGDIDYQVIGGHLKSATVAVTAEICIIPMSNRMIRIPTPNHCELFLLDGEKSSAN